MAVCDHSSRTVRRWLALGLAFGSALCVMVLVARTAVGAVSMQLAAWQIALLTAACCAVAMGAWRLDDEDRAADDRQSRVARAGIALLGGFLFGLLLARESGSGAASVVVVTLIWSTAALVRILRLDGSLSEMLASPQDETSVFGARTPRHSQQQQPEVPWIDATESCGPIGAGSDSGSFDDSLRIRLQRRATADGETVEIQAQLEFSAGAREAVLHVPFWPSLEGAPQVECEPLNGDDVELRVTSAERYGIRVEGRLRSAAVDPLRVPIGVEICVATAEDRRSAAA